jgi:hemolysin III
VQMPKSWASSKHLLPGTRSEIIADGIVHAIGVSLGLVGAIFLLLVSHSGSGGDITSIAVYTAGLLAVLGLSAAYNLWPVSPAKWVLRRFDHSAIYALIAATYTPFLAQLKTELAATGLMITVWVTAAIGAGIKLFLPGRFDRLAIALYLLLGWSGVIAYRPVVAALPGSTLWLLAVGGVLYSAGVISTYGTSCASRTRSGMGSCSSPRAAIIRQYLNS